MNELNFIDVEVATPAAQTVPQTNGQTSLDAVDTLLIGKGATALRADESGIWLGAVKWADAPFSVDMNGIIKSQSVAGGGFVLISGVDGRILINDGTTNRIVIGTV